jgi:hypothetical protein
MSPLHVNGYNGMLIIPYSAFGEPGEHNGFLMTERLCKAIFNVDMAPREPYMQSSFQAWNDEGMSADDMHKFMKKLFVNTSGRSRVQLFTAMLTIMAKVGKLICGRFKFTKSHDEVTTILEGLKTTREDMGAPDLKWLTVDNPEGDRAPYEQVFSEGLLQDLLLFGADSDLPILTLQEDDYQLFTYADRVDDYLLLVIDDIDENATTVYGLDTEFDKYSGVLSALAIAYSNIPVMIIHQMKMDRFPDQLKLLLERKQFTAAARNIGVDCSKLETQYGTVVPHRTELWHLALEDQPELAHIRDGTGLPNLVQTFLRGRMPIEKGIGQNDNLLDHLRLYVVHAMHTSIAVLPRK